MGEARSAAGRPPARELTWEPREAAAPVRGILAANLGCAGTTEAQK